MLEPSFLNFDTTRESSVSFRPDSSFGLCVLDLSSEADGQMLVVLVALGDQVRKDAAGRSGALVA